VPRGRPPTSVDPDASCAARLGAEIRACRAAHGLTLHALARRIGYTPQHISDAELAKSPVSEPFVAAVDRALGARGRLVALSRTSSSSEPWSGKGALRGASVQPGGR
jgi:transcriptional regulator with XRE-family HTH domain